MKHYTNTRTHEHPAAVGFVSPAASQTFVISSTGLRRAGMAIPPKPSTRRSRDMDSLNPIRSSSRTASVPWAGASNTTVADGSKLRRFPLQHRGPVARWCLCLWWCSVLISILICCGRTLLPPTIPLLPSPSRASRCRARDPLVQLPTAIAASFDGLRSFDILSIVPSFETARGCGFP
jgi:hypothetical protein